MPEPVRVTSKVRKPLSKSGIISFAHLGPLVFLILFVVSYDSTTAELLLFFPSIAADVNL